MILGVTREENCKIRISRVVNLKAFKCKIATTKVDLLLPQILRLNACKLTTLDNYR